MAALVYAGVEAQVLFSDGFENTDPGGLGDAEDSTLDMLDEVLDTAVAMLETGSSFDDVAAALAGMNGVSSVEAAGLSLSVVVGGVLGVVHDGAAARLDPAGADPLPFDPPPFDPAQAMRVNSASEIGSLDEAEMPTGQRMVGNDNNGDGKRDLEKRALLLAPYAFQFQPYESALPVFDRLSPLMDYSQAGGIELVANPPGSASNAVSLLHWLNWDGYDVIFASTHGDLVPLGSGLASPMLFTGVGILENSCVDMRDLVLAQTGNDTALVNTLACARVNKGTTDAPNWIQDIAAGESFFSAAYSGGLQKKLMYLEACRSVINNDLVDALMGTDSVVLGWTEYVYASFSREVARFFFGRSGTDGLPAWRAHKVTCGGGDCVEPTSPAQLRPGQTGPPELVIQYDRADLRIREGLEIPSEPMHGACSVYPGVPIEQSCPSCGGGIPIAFIYQATVDGLLTDDLVLRQDPNDFAVEQLRLFADADGEESGYALPLFTDNMTGLGDGAYSVLGGVTLFVDYACPGQVIEYEPWILLPAYDLTTGGIDSRDRMYSWEGPFSVEIVPQ